jgi:hypothetical protein
VGLSTEQKKAVALASARARAKTKAAVSKTEKKPAGSDRIPILSDIGDAMTAFQAGANQGMTLGFGDEIAAGMLSPITAIKPALEGKGYDLGKAYEENLDFVRGNVEADRAKNGLAALGGDIVGAAIPLSAVGATQLGGQMLGMTGSMPARIGFGGISGAGVSAVDTLGRGGSVEDAINSAKLGFGVGAGLPIIGALGKKAIAAATGKAFDPAEAALARAVDSDRIPVADIPARLQALGPEAVLADLGPNLQRQAGALASLPGEAQSMVRQALMDRAAGTNGRIIADTDTILGPAPIPSREAAAIQVNQRTLGPEYEAVFMNKALSPDFEFDPAVVGNAIDTAISETVGHTQRRLAEVRNMLTDPATGTYTTNPNLVFAARNELDGLIATEANPTTLGRLTAARQALDGDLGAQVAGLKGVDARYAELARQAEALTSGQQLLDSGRTAMRPAELETAMQEGALPQGQMVGPSAVPFRMSQGARAEIERIIGTTANDLNALKTALKGDGSWNRERLATLFGQDRADALLQVLERERTFDATNRIVTQNSETAARTAAQTEFSPGTTQFVRDMTVPGMIGVGLQKLANVGARTRRASTNAAVAEALMGRQLDPAMQMAVARALAQRQKPALMAPAALAAGLTGPGG